MNSGTKIPVDCYENPFKKIEMIFKMNFCVILKNFIQIKF